MATSECYFSLKVRNLLNLNKTVNLPFLRFKTGTRQQNSFFFNLSNNHVTPNRLTDQLAFGVGLEQS